MGTSMESMGITGSSSVVVVVSVVVDVDELH